MADRRAVPRSAAAPASSDRREPPRRTRRLCCAAAMAALATAFAAPAATAGVVAVEVPTDPSWSALRFLGADPRGRVFLLRSETLEVYPLNLDGLGDPIALEPATGFERAGALIAASMGSSSGDWLLRTGAFEVKLFRGREEVPVAATWWLVQNVVLADGTPVAAAAPMRGPGSSPDDPPPFLLQLAGHSWDTLVEASPFDDVRLTSTHPEESMDAYRELRWRETVALASADGPIWAANQFVFRLREYSAAGRLRSTITLGADPEMEIVSRSTEEIDRFRAAMVASGHEPPADSSRFSVKPRETIVGLAVGRDGRIYFLSHGDGRLDLARWDPLRSVLERTEIAGPGIPVVNLRLASGRHALFAASVTPDAGCWAISWEAIEAAEWRPFPDVYLDGVALPLPPVDDAEPAPASS